jgi:hypothetical protein
VDSWQAGVSRLLVSRPHNEVEKQEDTECDVVVMAELKRIVRSSEIEVADRLSELELTRADLVDCILFGESLRDACTANDPKTVPGIFAWAGIIRMLREKYLVKGWKRSEKNGLPVIVNSAKTIAIAVKSGDENTSAVGDGISPKTKRPVGGAAAAAVTQNQRQLRLNLKYSTDAVRRGSECATWFLLRRRDRNLSICGAVASRMGRRG